MKYTKILVVFAALFITSCAGPQLAKTLKQVGKTAGDVAGYVAEASNDLSLVEQMFNAYLAVAPMPLVQAEFAKLDQAARLGLSTASSATDGVKEVSNQQLVAAFADFKEAYGKIEALAKNAGVLAPGTKTAAGASLPSPRAARLVGM